MLTVGVVKGGLHTLCIGESVRPGPGRLGSVVLTSLAGGDRLRDSCCVEPILMIVQYCFTRLH